MAKERRCFALVLAGIAACLTHCACVRPPSALSTIESVMLTASSPVGGAPSPVLRVSGRHFVDARGRVVILRGVNLAGDSKVPPFRPISKDGDLDPLVPLGFNVVRLVFIWEAFEPTKGEYDEAYLRDMRRVAAACAERGMFVIVDIHQDGFSRFTSRGAGDGFPSWAVSPEGEPSKPSNGPESKNWPLLMASDPTTHRSFTDFFADTHGVRTAYLAMLERVASVFSSVPNVIGYDPINEPWGDEVRELSPLYADAAKVIQARHPGAILFLEGHVTTNSGLPTKLPEPAFRPVAYAPHYYRPLTILLNRWHGTTAGIDAAFRTMSGTAEAWNAPLLLGEFGVNPEAVGSAGYVETLYDRLDAELASGTQWNYTPHWTEAARDGWNGEDFSILDLQGRPRANFSVRPYPRATAGQPITFRFSRRANGGGELAFTWRNDPGRGETEIFLPAEIFPPDRTRVEVAPEGVTWEREDARSILRLRFDRAEQVELRVIGD